MAPALGAVGGSTVGIVNVVETRRRANSGIGTRRGVMVIVCAGFLLSHTLFGGFADE